MEMFEAIIDIWVAVITGLLYIILLFTSPIWIVPYLIYRTVKQKRGGRE